MKKSTRDMLKQTGDLIQEIGESLTHAKSPSDIRNLNLALESTQSTLDTLHRMETSK